MSHLAEKSVKNHVTTETQEKKWENFENRKARLRDQKHLEMAYEWLRNRGKTDLLKGAIESL
jgi:hypothetical protein